MDAVRLDVALVGRGLCASRERAQQAIRSGLVKVNGQTAVKCSVKVSDSDALELLGAVHPYVGRGGLKLEHALDAFCVLPDGQVCLDVGASTGGFTDVLLRRGARLVYAVDVGAGQLDASLRADDRVVVREHTNARSLTATDFDPRPTLAVMDVSFISIRLILPALRDVLGDAGRVISLVKPQFEAGPKVLDKHGVVGDRRVHEQVLIALRDQAPSLGWHLRALTGSPILGGSGNREFLADWVTREVPPPSDDDIRALVRNG